MAFVEFTLPEPVSSLTGRNSPDFRQELHSAKIFSVGKWGRFYPELLPEIEDEVDRLVTRGRAIGHFVLTDDNLLVQVEDVIRENSLRVGERLERLGTKEGNDHPQLALEDLLCA